ncbi:GGDEF domain-containing protein [Methylobacterium sp. NEAU 140]|uniref:GGDEF domain-containing protein n=1 Tax=Methylobacterium sp. NEAU 140 TaxID=3064945 RepID=UPI0027356992|nr:GGDEF domain-containing protein [Methylobacterium sp. NEAU 140]MDP4026853.1 GGDEF domain-containing protein [Methylobacterium sp. NEAU 140]
MNSAAFLLAINGAIGLSFATAFVALTWRSGIRLGRWCAVGFLAAAATVTVEALASTIPWPRLTSTLSFGLLMLALTTTAAGLIRHYRPCAPVTWLFGCFVAATAVNALVVFDLPRGSWEQAFGYQGPFALMLATSAGAVLVTSPRRPVDVALAVVLALSSAQFLTKAVLSGLAGHGPGVRDYIVSAYAFYSQTAGGILSLLLGLALVGLVVTEVMTEAKLRLQRDGLSGLFNRAAFMERVPEVLRRSGSMPVALILADLDRFKSINDRFGHAAGDEVIRVFAADLRAYFEDGVLVGRLGGEEFCALVPNCGPPAARIHLEALRWLGRQNRHERLPADAMPTASFGVAFIGRDETFDEALQRADVALYEAKAAGRDCYRFASIRVDTAAPGRRPVDALAPSAGSSG